MDYMDTNMDTKAEHKPDFELTKNTPYSSLVRLRP